MGKKIGQRGHIQLINIAHKCIVWFYKVSLVSSKRKGIQMSLFSNEQKHRKVKKKIQGSCLDTLQNSLQLQKVRNDDSEDLQQHTRKTSQAAGVSPWIWYYTSGFAALATKSEVGALWAGKIKLDKKAAFVRNTLSLRDILKVHVLFFF